MSSTGTNEGPSSGLQGLMGDTRRTAHEYVRDTIRQAILRGQLAAGTRLVQANLASELGVSTTPVREALRAGDADQAAEIAAEHVRLTIRVLERSHSSLADDEG